MAMPTGLGKGKGKGNLPPPAPTIGDIAIEFATSELGARIDECDWVALAEAAADHVAKCRQTHADMLYKDMMELTALTRFALRFLSPEDDPNNNHAVIRAWRGRRTAFSDGEDEDESEAEADASPVAPPLADDADGDGTASPVPTDLESMWRKLEAVTRELKRNRKRETGVLATCSQEQHKRKREMQGQASELVRLQRQVALQAQCLREVQLRFQQADTGRDPQTGEYAEPVYHPLADAGCLGAPTDSQIVALAYAMERAFPNKGDLADLCKLLRFKEGPVVMADRTRRSPREAFKAKAYELDMWRDVATNRGVFWSCYNYLLLRQPYSTLVDPSLAQAL